MGGSIYSKTQVSGEFVFSVLDFFFFLIMIAESHSKACRFVPRISVNMLF